MSDHDELAEILAWQRERIAMEIEADRVAVTAPSGSNERAWQLGHNKGLADAARVARDFDPPREHASATSREPLPVLSTEEQVEYAQATTHRHQHEHEGTR